MNKLKVMKLSYNIFIGYISSNLCTMSNLNTLYFNENNQLSCYSNCLNTISNKNYGTVRNGCATNQDIAICSFIAATNINSIFSQWSCTTAGIVSTNPCDSNMGSSVWQGILCINDEIFSIMLSSTPITLMGIFIYI